MYLLCWEIYKIYSADPPPKKNQNPTHFVCSLTTNRNRPWEARHLGQLAVCKHVCPVGQSVIRASATSALVRFQRGTEAHSWDRLPGSDRPFVEGPRATEESSSVCTQSLKPPQLLHRVLLPSQEVSSVPSLCFFLFCGCVSADQNRFSSKMAIKSLWKFMSIVAAIWGEKQTFVIIPEWWWWWWWRSESTP